MSRTIILDTGPLGLVTHPGSKQEAKDCQAWFAALLMDGVQFLVPAIADYELRRELIRAGRHQGLARLDGLINHLGSSPIDQEVIKEAARLWAEARRIGLPTAPDLALDGDCFLAAHANMLFVELSRLPDNSSAKVVVATTNPNHLSRMTPARHWRDLDASFV